MVPRYEVLQLALVEGVPLAGLRKFISVMRYGSRRLNLEPLFEVTGLVRRHGDFLLNRLIVGSRPEGRINWPNGCL